MKINAIRPMTVSQNYRKNNMSSPSFQGKRFQSGYYDDDEIELAQKFVNQSEEWRANYKKNNKMGFKDAYKVSEGLNYVLSPLTRPFCYDWKDATKNAGKLANVCTVFLWEIANSPANAIEATIRRYNDGKRIDEKTARVATLIGDLKQIREEELRREALEAANSALFQKEKELEFEKKKDFLIENFAERVEDESIGKSADIPNVIMIEEKHEKWGSRLIDELRKSSNTLFVHINREKLESDGYGLDVAGSLINELKQSSEVYEKSGMRTLIEVDNLDMLLHKENNDELIDIMKEMLNTCATDDKATIIFKTNDSSSIHHEINVPHRIGVKVEC